MRRKDIYYYYGREDVQQALLGISEKREVVGVFSDGGFATRPNTLIYPKDITMLVSSGVVAFHGSLERWSNPMAVGSEHYEDQRIGWDMILDFDCEKTEHGKVAVMVFLDVLRKHGIGNVSVKFTGSTGFHLGVPFESMPATVDYSDTKEQYPSLARKIIRYLKFYSRESMEKALLKKWSIENLAEQTGKKVGEIMSEEGIDPYKIVEVDPVLISPRHLFRLPYSLHEKTHLVSLPLDPDNLADFRPDDASPEKLDFRTGFLDKSKKDEASCLVMEAVEWVAKQETRTRKKEIRSFELRRAVPLKLAPPCVNNILKGLPDGRKRSLFILINYLSSLKWEWDAVGEELVRWNQKNKPPLGDNYVRSQIRWHRNRKKVLPPPNCKNPGYYESFGACRPDVTCGGQKKTVTNPVNYAFRKMKNAKKK